MLRRNTPEWTRPGIAELPDVVRSALFGFWAKVRMADLQPLGDRTAMIVHESLILEPVRIAYAVPMSEIRLLRPRYSMELNRPGGSW
ncbi:hypothetical protein Adu01nite_70300 [Paractinoplanes durhamensis]|uniref:Uncharacterized protein n=1 Tax=Paractinoplanes durhamensis TaxID=113563 RepID=A0ABQ3Z783_9ACTN|nr:hypothetical protein Adu01nite_70300 [Actinoplanes durhamensis]